MKLNEVQKSVLRDAANGGFRDLVEALNRQGLMVGSAHQYENGWEVRLRQRKGLKWYEPVWDAGIARAVCLAALKALEDHDG